MWTRRRFLASFLALLPPSYLRIGAPEVAFTKIDQQTGANNGYGTTLDTAGTLNVAAGDLLVGLGVAMDAGSISIAVAEPGGGNAFTMSPTAYHSAGVAISLGYKIGATANATCTLRMTTLSADYRRIGVYQFRPTAGATVTLTAGPAPATGTGAAPTSGTISPTGTDIVVVSGVGSYATTTFTNPVINAVAADGSAAPGSYSDFFYRILTAGFANGTAALDAANSWAIDVLAFAAASAGHGRVLGGSPLLASNILRGLGVR